MNPLPPVTSMHVMLRVHFKLNYDITMQHLADPLG